MTEDTHLSSDEHRRPSRISQVPVAARSAARRLVLVAVVALFGSALGVRLALPARAAEPASDARRGTVEDRAGEGLTVRYAVDGECRRQVFVAPADGGPWERVGGIGAGESLTLRLRGAQGMRVGLVEGEDLNGAIAHADRYEAPAGGVAHRAVTVRCSG